VDRKANATGGLGDVGTSVQRLEDALDGIAGHAEQETGGQLGATGARIEQGGRRVGEPALGHQCVSLHSRRGKKLCQPDYILFTSLIMQSFNLCKLNEQKTHIDRRLDVLPVDSDGHPHEHVLRPLHHFAIYPEQIGTLQGFEAKVGVVEVSLVDHHLIELLKGAEMNDISKQQ